jgi:hypothetical protein
MVTGEQVGFLDKPVCGPGLASIRMGGWDEDIRAGREDLGGNGKEGVFTKEGEYLGIDERGVVSGPVAIPSLDVSGECGLDGQGRVFGCDDPLVRRGTGIGTPCSARGLGHRAALGVWDTVRAWERAVLCA